MSSLQELVEERGGLRGSAVDVLQAIVSDWQILADLSFADLLLFCREPTSGELTVVAHMRPYTAQTIYNEDLVGTTFAPDARQAVTRTFAEGTIVRDGEPDWSTGVPVREEAIPVPLDGEVIAVVTREANLSMVRAPSQLELTYLQAANELSSMLAEGAFPFPGEDPERELAPRVGDGLMRVDPSGTVVYASPNAISAYRRLGVVDNIVGRNLSTFDLDDVAVLEALGDGEPLDSEVEARGAVVLRRLLPLTREHHVLGALVLIREVTELRRHERLLLYKDATIREIHHRVKNNLQTVASLLRLQSRRLSSEEARQALGESVRRISSIALVHETLSQDSRQRVSFDKVAGRLLDMLGTGLTDPERPVTMELAGDAGELPAEVATPLALVLSELVQNSVEHAFPDRGGRIVIDLERRPASLHLTVIDDGVGVPEGWGVDADANLGLRIATTLVESELGGTLAVERSGPDGGTTCELLLPLPR
ncbi:sensor histidine kinase [Nitriliruptor alkaliphilus]|uniref:sensor histidine kinase n=1 Tax=Nitriliruptor alkaliphilus TaxID=427918 RepID=UPI0006965556|nr:sensor histidine kinase [Nitriliruptor alkaliphilus]